MGFIKKNILNILVVLIVLLLLIPQVRVPVQVFLQRAISFAPSTIAEDKREVVTDYHWLFYDVNNGQTKDLESSHNKVVLINLWATWCPPCIAEMPSLQDLYDEFGDRVDFYFVSYERQDKLENFLQKNNYTLPVYRPLSTAPDNFNSNVLPTTYLISKSGEVVINKTGAANWNSSKIHDLLEELLNE